MNQQMHELSLSLRSAAAHTKLFSFDIRITVSRSAVSNTPCATVNPSMHEDLHVELDN
jgi:hypothetical protein